MGKKIGIGCIIIFIILSVLIVSVLILYPWRKMIVLNENVDEAWSEVLVTYQSRLDLVSNLVNSARGYMQLEKDIFESIANARAGINEAENLPDLEKANESTSQALSSFIDNFNVVVEDTPEIKSNLVISDLMTQLEGTENRIAVARIRFNEDVKDYNIFIKTPPWHIFARWFGFEEKEFFEAQPGAEIAPEVDLELE